MKLTRKGKKRTVLHIVAVIALTVLFLAAAVCNAFIPEGFANWYGAVIFPNVSIIFQTFNMFFHYSLTENLIICLVPALAIGLVAWLVILVKKLLTSGAALYIYKSYRNLMIIALLGALIFQSMHGFNYRRTDVTDELEFIEKELTFEDYCEALRWAYLGMIEARSKLGEDYNGVAHMNESFENSASFANSLVDSFAEKYDIPLSGNYVRAKPVSMSHYWSYTYIVGAYDMFLGEVNLNTDYMGITEYPITLCHELCHAKGYASETDCNTIAVLACCSSSRPDFRYAGYYEIFWNLYAMAEDIADKTGEVVPQYASTSEMNPVYRDMSADIIYWKKIDNEVDAIKEKFGIDITETSDKVNDTFLRSNGEKGLESYHVPDSVYVRFYLTHVAEVEDA